MTNAHEREDEELFAPFAQVFRVDNFDDAIARANDTKSVSYTHLDVYKRQGSTEVGTLFLNPQPVSYTHLDVYKRQW